jgi:hypothetical protein
MSRKWRRYCFGGASAGSISPAAAIDPFQEHAERYPRRSRAVDGLGGEVLSDASGRFESTFGNPEDCEQAKGKTHGFRRAGPHVRQRIRVPDVP